MSKSPLCLAPWVHSFVHTSGERGLCCVSQRVRLEDPEYWNSSFYLEVRKKLSTGEFPDACAICKNNPRPLYLDFEQKFGHLRENLLAQTDDDNRVKVLPVSFDHRNSYVCNFKCRMCNAEYSSAKKKEQLEIQGKDSLPQWMRPENEPKVRAFHKNVSEPELIHAVERGEVKEIYWAGGEPLLNPFHWLVMDLVFQRSCEKNLLVSYNTNLSIMDFQGKNFVGDILQKLSNFTVMASLDGTGVIGEYIRSGLNWSDFQFHLEKILPLRAASKTVAISHCLTTPGIFDLKNFLQFTNERELTVVSQLVDFGFENNFENPLNPLFFPKEIRFDWLNRVLEEIAFLRNEKNESLFCLLESLREQKGNVLSDERKRNIRGVLKKAKVVEEYRGGIRFEDIIKKEPALVHWLSQNFS